MDTETQRHLPEAATRGTPTLIPLRTLNHAQPRWCLLSLTSDCPGSAPADGAHIHIHTSCMRVTQHTHSSTQIHTHTPTHAHLAPLPSVHIQVHQEHLAGTSSLCRPHSNSCIIEIAATLRYAVGGVVSCRRKWQVHRRSAFAGETQQQVRGRICLWCCAYARATLPAM